MKEDNLTDKLTKEEQQWVKQLADDPNVRVSFLSSPGSLRRADRKSPFYKKWKKQNGNG